MNAIEREILIRIGENPDTPDVFTEGSEDMAMIRQSINDAIQEICMLSASYKKTYLLPLRQDCQFYRLKWDLDHIGYVISVWDRTRKWKLTSTDPVKLGTEDQLWLKRHGVPLEYFQVGYDTLGIYMRPSASGAVLEVECVAIPADYINSDSPVKIRDHFQHSLTEFAISDFFASRGDAKRAQTHFEDYAESVGHSINKMEAGERQFRAGGFQPTSVAGSGQPRNT